MTPRNNVAVALYTTVSVRGGLSIITHPGPKNSVYYYVYTAYEVLNTMFLRSIEVVLGFSIM